MVRNLPYINKFVLNAIVDGHIVPDPHNDGNVALPFDSEYALRFRNRHNRRAVVKVEVDGENISGGGWIIPANSFIDVERTADVAKRFKFVSLVSEDAADFGKNGPNASRVLGTVTAHFFLEKEYAVSPQAYFQDSVKMKHSFAPTTINNHYYDRGMGIVGYYDHANLSSTTDSAASASLNINKTVCRDHHFGFCEMPTMSPDSNAPVSSDAIQDGCTVEGSNSDQRFLTAHVNIETHSTTVTMFMRGYDPDTVQVAVKAPKKNTRKKDNGPAKPSEDNAVAINFKKENEALRVKIAALENAELKARLAELENKANEAVPA